MTDGEALKLRDFTYLDVDRLKSLLAQLDRGLLSARADSSGSSTDGEAGAEASVPLLAKVGGTLRYLTTDQSTETRTLHDFVFNEVEERLEELGRIVSLPQDFSGPRLLSEEVRSALSGAEFVRVDGRISISDYAYVIELLEDMNAIYAASTELSFMSRLQAAKGNEVNKVRNEMQEKIKSHSLNPKLSQNLRKIFDAFLKDRIVVRGFPFAEDPNIRVVGPLQREYFRESPDDIRFKFGTSPKAEWTVFGQIAAVPQENETRDSSSLAFTNEVEKAIEGLIGSIRPIENMFRVRYPEIAITPIALYRD